MLLIDWNDCPKVGQSFMDRDHEETVGAINVLHALADKAVSGETDDSQYLLEKLLDFASHIHDHFERENQAMEQTGFFALGCHRDEHQRVEELLQGQIKVLQDGGLADVREFIANDLPDWFYRHLTTMDSITAQHLQAHGYVA